MKATFKGVDALRRKLAALPKVAVDEMQKAMAEGADEIRYRIRKGPA